jgi:hypothetical protein
MFAIVRAFFEASSDDLGGAGVLDLNVPEILAQLNLDPTAVRLGFNQAYFDDGADDLEMAA